MAGTHFKNTASRDTGQFPRGREAKAKAYHSVRRARSDNGIAEIGRIPKGFRRFPAPRRSGPLEVPIGTPSGFAPSGTGKQLKTRRRGIFEMGSKKIIVIYHGGCRDGFGGAWAARKKFGDKAEYIPAFDRFAPPRELKGKEIYLIDYTYREDVIKKLMRDNVRVTAIDHHITAERAVKMTEKYSFSLRNSGAVLAWKYFHPGKKVPTLLRIVEDSDLWKWKVPRSKEILAFMDLLKMDFASWDKIAKDLENNKKRGQYAEKGALILHYDKYLLDELSRGAELVRFAGHTGYAVNAPHHFVSDVGYILAKRRHSFAAVWREQAGEIRVSLRSDGSVDVAKIAQKFGGGGHKKAAGFSFPAGRKFPWKIIGQKKHG